jgi:predicted enzyme related to lactoylglutathione lyase
MDVSFFSVSVDCGDAAKTADFWSQVLNRPVDPGATQDFAAIGLEPAEPPANGAAGPVWMFHKVPEAKAVKNRLHIDFVCADLPGAVERALTLGATHLADIEEGGYRWATLADPEGNEFDIVAVAS